jgi:uncharacterized protein YneR
MFFINSSDYYYYNDTKINVSLYKTKLINKQTLSCLAQVSINTP